MSGLRTNRVHAVGVYKSRTGLTPDQIKARAPAIFELIKNILIVQQNLLKYEVSFKVERLPKTLAGDLSLQETELDTLILVEGTSRKKIREALTSSEYRQVLARSLEHATTREDFHFFSGEFLTVVDN
ncbi:hypothetical protein B0H14DRAFT_3464898 [Mycena olivaceomarginata]|nr:hypothetical protein B0H14DRAFT_3464898 [Mycena olivaceomarginata]